MVYNQQISNLGKENIQVEQLLRPCSKTYKQNYPQEPIYESALPNEITAGKRQKEQRNIKRKVDWRTNANQYRTEVQWLITLDETKSKSNVSLTKNRRQKHLPSTQSMYNRCTSHSITRNIQGNQKWNIRQFPIFQMHTKPRRITPTIPLTIKKSSTLQLGRFRRQLSRKHFYPRKGKPPDPNGSAILR